MPGAGDGVPGFWLGCRLVDGPAELDRDDLVLLAVDGEDRQPYLLEYVPSVALRDVSVDPLVDLMPHRALSPPEIICGLKSQPELG